MSETHRHIVGQLRHLEASQLPVTAMQRNQFFRPIQRSFPLHASRATAASAEGRPRQLIRQNTMGCAKVHGGNAASNSSWNLRASSRVSANRGQAASKSSDRLW